MIRPVIRFYERQYHNEQWLKDYESILRKIFSKYIFTGEEIIQRFFDSKSNCWLDIACGNGSLIFKVHNHFRYSCGIDICFSRIKEARSKLTLDNNKKQNSIFFLQANADDALPFRDNSFDVVSGIAILEHIFDPYFLVEEIKRILKNEGIFILLVPNIAYIKHRIRLLFGRLPATSAFLNWKLAGWDGGHLHYFTKASIYKLLEEFGFLILKIKGSGVFAPLRNWYPALLSGDFCIKARLLKKV